MPEVAAGSCEQRGDAASQQATFAAQASLRPARRQVTQVQQRLGQVS
jgi:hypothetical protein